MTSSRNKAGLLLTLPLFLGLALPTPFAAAQGKPLSLVPPPLGQTTEERAATGSAAPSVPAERAPAKNVLEGPGVTGAVVIQSLRNIGPATVGTLSEADGGFDSLMWRGTAPTRITSLIRQLPIPVASPEMQQLYRRLLLSAAIMPDGLQDPAALLALRLDRLVEAGLVTDAAELLARLPAADMTPSLERTAIELDLLRGADETACQRISSRQVETADNFWAKTDIFCSLAAGNIARADLNLTLLGEAAQDDPMFVALFDRLAGGKAKLPENDQPLTFLHIAMMRKADLDVPLSAIENAGYAFLWALANDEGAPLDERFVAAYRSLGVGSVAPELPRGLIRDGAFKSGGDAAGELGNIAALYREMTSTTPEAERRRIVSDIWAAGDRDSSYLTAAALAVPPMLMVSPSDEDAAFALNALRVSLITGEVQNAVAWERMIRRGALKGDFAARETSRRLIARSAAYMLISGVPGIARWNAETFDVTDFGQSESAVQNDNAGLYLAILEALGETVPASLWTDALAIGQPPRTGNANMVIEKNLVAAAEAGRLGETVALSLAALGEEGPGMASTPTLYTVLKALTSVGLEASARKLALEAAVARNL
ncbi:hypothetical protein [Sneathiella sp.]|uniref:hypothetical protein n=1 Tax=Sneathiella sp. TaxID=1964365 RepID=UPI002FE2ADE3